MNRGEYIISVDIGTTSAKGMLYRIGGHIECQEDCGYNTYYPQQGFVEQDPDEVLRAVVEVLQSLVEKSRVHTRTVAAISFGGIWQSILPVDRLGKPLTRAILWSDSRSVNQSRRLRGEMKGEEVKTRTGCSIHPMYFLPRLAWFKEEAGEVYRQTHKFVSIKEYVLYHLYGRFAVDRSIASGTGVFRMSRADWDGELLHTIGVGVETLSEVMETTTFLGNGLKDEIASRTGLLTGTPGVLGAADGALSHLGSVGVSEERMSLTVGTGSALRRRLSEPKVLEGKEAWCYYMTEGNWLLGGVVHDAGNVLRWFADSFISSGSEEEKVFEIINAFAEEIEPGAEGLVFLPFLAGERCPYHRPEARGAIHGLTFTHGKKHLARALMEGVSYRLYSVYEMLAGESRPELVVTGGLLKSSTWLKITADFFGKKLWKPRIKEASAWGGVLIGLRALGVIDRIEDIDRWVDLEGKQEPDLKTHRIYQKVYSSYQRLYSQLYEAT